MDTRVRNMEIPEIKGPQQLEAEVQKSGLCTLCGICAGMCPYNLVYKGRLVVRDRCNLTTGRCYAFCPRTSANLELISNSVFGVGYPLDELGVVKDVVMARTREPEIGAKAQYGGTVSSLVCFALTEELVDSAILTASDRDMLPAGTVARSRKEVIECAGSNYVAAPTLEVLNTISDSDAKRMIVVGTPCQVLALGKMRMAKSQYPSRVDKVELILGLFCTWALSSAGFLAFLRQSINLSEVRRFDIPPPPADVFEVYTASRQKKTFSLDLIREFILPGCRYCFDMTSEFADISVGAVEGILGWNTVIIRSEKGEELVNRAKARGVIETAKLPVVNLHHLKEASLLKKRRALERILATTGNKENLLYLRFPSGSGVEFTERYMRRAEKG